jgi:hypothetical protein
MSRPMQTIVDLLNCRTRKPPRTTNVTMTLQIQLIAPDAEGLNQLTRKEFAALAKVCERTIRREVERGRIAEIRMNRRRIRYSLEAVRAYLAGKYPNTAIEGTASKVNGNDGNDSTVSRNHEIVAEPRSAAQPVGPEQPIGKSRPGEPKKPYNQVFSVRPFFWGGPPFQRAHWLPVTVVDTRRFSCRSTPTARGGRSAVGCRFIP